MIDTCACIYVIGMAEWSSKGWSWDLRIQEAPRGQLHRDRNNRSLQELWDEDCSSLLMFDSRYVVACCHPTASSGDFVPSSCWYHRSGGILTYLENILRHRVCLVPLELGGPWTTSVDPATISIWFREGLLSAAGTRRTLDYIILHPLYHGVTICASCAMQDGEEIY